MERIESFKVDHLNLDKGLYVSRKDCKEGCAVTTFDLRFTAPNKEPVMDMPALHTIEHLGATYLRNSQFKDDVVYFGPMGCRTGFYLLLRDSVSPQAAIDLVKDAFAFIAEFDGEIPGSTRVECGNYLEHDLEGAKASAKDMLSVLRNWNTEMLSYAYHGAD